MKEGRFNPYVTLSFGVSVGSMLAILLLVSGAVAWGCGSVPTRERFFGGFICVPRCVENSSNAAR